MKRRKHIIGNWKMNHGLEEIRSFFIDFSKVKMELNCLVAIAPQFIHIPILKELAFTTGNMQIGAQNAAETDSGAFTGEVSAKSLKDMGVDFVILGHSERRSLYKEGHEVLNRKLKNALKNDLPVVFCIGETLSERESGKTFEVVKEQLEQGLNGISASQMEKIILAYEPVWAIGTGKNASKEEAEEVHQYIRSILPHRKNEAAILYGGSVKPDNIDGLLSMPNIDGALVGGASLKASDFKALCVSASRF